MSSYLWKVKAVNVPGKVIKGMEVEVVKNGTNSKPNIKEIGEAFTRKYGIQLINGCYMSNFIITLTK